MELRPHHGMCFQFYEGKGYSEYNEELSAAANRRVEVFMYASKEMIQAAEAEAKTL